MSLYDELQQSYEDQEAAFDLQLELLAKSAEGLVSSLEDYLGIPSPKWNYPNGKAGDAYIRLGEGASSDFEPKRWRQLSSEDGVVPFSVAITIVSKSREKRLNVILEMDVRFCKEGYKFVLNNKDHRVLSVESVKAGNFEIVHQLIVHKLKEHLDPEIVVIRT